MYILLMVMFLLSNWVFGGDLRYTDHRDVDERFFPASTQNQTIPGWRVDETTHDVCYEMRLVTTGPNPGINSDGTLPPGTTLWSDTASYTGVNWSNPYDPLRNTSANSFIDVPGFQLLAGWSSTVTTFVVNQSGIKRYARQDSSDYKHIARYFSTDLWLSYRRNDVGPETTDPGGPSGG